MLAIWIGVGFIFRGTATTVAAISERGLPGRGWLIFYGVISLIAGFVVMAWPFDSIVVLAITIGVWLVIMGVFDACPRSASAKTPTKSRISATRSAGRPSRTAKAQQRADAPPTR